MGIPYYFSNITREHTDIVKSDLKVISKYLFLDFNCAIHYCNNAIKKESNYNIDNHEELLIAKCLKYIDTIVDNSHFKGTLFISIDGVVPFAKMIQQRKRRYLSVWRNTKLKINTWDSNAISPGTEFMKKLNKALHEYKNTQLTTVIISDSTNPGEGEAKIYKYIKKENIVNENIIIYGLDADLIMLSLLQENNVFLMRESEFYKFKLESPFLYLDISHLKRELIKYIEQSLNNAKIKNHLQSYVLLCYLIGNDFVPSLSYLKIKNGSIDFMLHLLSKCIDEDGEELMYINDEGKWDLNWIMFQKLTTSLMQFEDHEFSKNHYKYYNYSRNYNSDTDYYDNYGMFNKLTDSIKPDEDGWRHRYYTTLFPNIKVDTICKNYIEGIKWNIQYYFNDTCHTKWYYKYDYSPTLFDLNNYLTVNDVNIISYNQDVDFIDSTKHLMCILPQPSHNLLCDEKKALVKTFKYIKYYPMEYKVQTYLKQYLHDCIPLIPHMDFEKI